ncbi:hypothetical protein V496_10351 [Pseudogymnoascus sp. VKM F-4515 (FW-2607)]|nr:hypothetical protein V496_10351 [Pseudogymnoascus sp. VKM F-4515 (FW-2607)]
MWTDGASRILSRIRALVVLFLVFPLVLCDAPVTIDQSDAYGNQRVCAFGCFQDFNDIGYPIAQEISCPTFRVMNDCFCRHDLQQEAHLTATSLYDNYCANNGYTTEALATTAAQDSGSPATSSPTSALSSPTPTPTAQTTVHTSTSATQASKTSFPSSTSVVQESSAPTNESTTPQMSSSKEDKLGVGEIVGIVVGILALIVAVITLIVNWKTLKSRMNSAPPATTPAP